MKIKKAIEIYTLSVPQPATLSFFDTTSYQSLYFRSREGAEFYHSLLCCT